MFTKLSEQDMRDEIDHLIDQRQDLLQIQDLVKYEARRDWYSNTYSGLRVYRLTLLRITEQKQLITIEINIIK